MMSKIHLFKCIVLLNLVAVDSFGLVWFKNMNEKELLSKLAEILDAPEGSTVEKNHVAVRSARKDLDTHKKFERRKLIKTYVPHGQKVNFKTEGESLYKTLFRMHMKNKHILNNVSDAYKVKLDSVARIDEPINSSEHDENKIKPSKKLDQKKISKHLTNFWKKLKALKYKYRQTNPKANTSIVDHENEDRSKRSLSKAEISQGFSRLWNRFSTAFQKDNKQRGVGKEKAKKTSRHLHSDKQLRSGRSGEEHDPLAPGKLPFHFELQMPTTEKTYQWQPVYSFWNYWTYDKSLYQDICKGGLIKVGNRCIGSPPH